MNSPALRAATLAFALVAAPAGAETLCLQVAVNDLAAGAETRLRLSASGQPAVSASPAEGRVRIDGLAAGTWTVTLRHPNVRAYRTEVTLPGSAGLLLDCGHADQWSGCQLRPLPGGC